MKFELLIDENLQGIRLDQALAKHPQIKSRSRAAHLINSGLVLYQNRPVKPSYLTTLGQIFIVSLPAAEPSSLQPLKLQLDILFEDQDLIVVNKPAGLVMHPAPGHAQDTLVNALLYHCQELAMGFNEQRPGIVHRLDKDTSGVLVVAKNDFAHEALAQQFRARTIHRLYWALALGDVRPTQGTIRSYLARHPTQRLRFASLKNSENSGKLAITHYSLKKKFSNGISLLHCRLETGRTHQIRVHLSELNCPLLGDRLYGSNVKTKNIKNLELREMVQKLARVGLHAAELGFIHPRSKEKVAFSAPWPDDLLAIVRFLEKGGNV